MKRFLLLLCFLLTDILGNLSAAVLLSWDSPDGDAALSIALSKCQGADCMPLASLTQEPIPMASGHYVDVDVAPGQTYTYAAKTINSLGLISEASAATIALAASPGYPIVYVSSPRPGGDTVNSKVPDAVAVLSLEPGSHLMLLPAGSATPTILVNAGNGAVTDPFVSYDGTKVYYSLCPDMRQAALNSQRFNLPYQGCDIYVVTVATGVKTKLIGQEFWRPNGIVNWSTRPDSAQPAGSHYLGYGIVNLSPVPLPNGDLFFMSNAHGLDIVKGYVHPNLQGFMLYADTGHIEQVWFPPTGILHAAPLSATGEISFATLENEQFGKPHRWAIWSMLPSGQSWRPLFSATMEGPHTRHFHTEYQGNLVTASYYISFNAGLGALLSAPLIPPSQPAFGSPDRNLNPITPMGKRSIRFAYTPTGMTNITPLFHQFDDASDLIGGQYTGKTGFPWAAPDGLLISYSGGPANLQMRPTNVPRPQLGIYRIPSGVTVDAVSDLELIIDDPARNEFYARPVVPYSQVYGVAAPLTQPTRPINGGGQHAQLPPGTPFALIGSSSVYKRESCGGQFAPGWQCAKQVYTIDDNQSSNRAWQGGDTHLFSNSAIHAIQILTQIGVSHLSYGPQQSGYAVSRSFEAAGGNERFHILGEIPLRKFNGSGQPILDANGNPDTSFLAKIPADMPFTFRLVDNKGMVLTHSPTWHQLRPGEVRTDCGGCHAHAQAPLAFSGTEAGKAGFVPVNLTTAQPESVEFHRDVEPILGAKCVACHNPVTNAANLDLQTSTMVGQPPSPRNYTVLAKDTNGTLAGPPPIAPYVGRASRYVAPFAAAESLLAWVVARQRLDGVANTARPTETIPGNVNSLQPPGTRQLADIDYPVSVHNAHNGLNMTAAEVRTIIEWIDLGMPRDVNSLVGWFADELAPVISWREMPTYLILGIHDVSSGFNPATSGALTITRDGLIVPPGFYTADHRMTLPKQAGLWKVVVKDQAGNSTTLLRRVQ